MTADREPEVTILPPESGQATGGNGTTYAHAAVPDIDAMPDLYDGILLKRILAYGVDLVILGILFVGGWLALTMAAFLTLGLLWPLVALFGLILAPCYHSFLISGPAAATLGMRLFGIHVRTLDGRRPSLLQAFVMFIVFAITVPTTSGLVLLVALFNGRRRTLHDLLSGTVVVNRLI